VNNILSGLVGGLLTGWILSLFGFDDVVVRGMHELFSLEITDATYYLMFAVAGVIGGIIGRM